MGTVPDGDSVRRGSSHEAVLAVLAARGKVSSPESLQLQVPYFADGAVLGTRGLVDTVFWALREKWGPTRRDEAHPVQGVTFASFATCGKGLLVTFKESP